MPWGLLPEKASHGFHGFTRINLVFICCCVVRELSAQSVTAFLSLGRDGEVYRDAGFGLDGQTRLQIGAEAPLLHRFAGRG
jgi:hypothetical protein